MIQDLSLDALFYYDKLSKILSKDDMEIVDKLIEEILAQNSQVLLVAKGNLYNLCQLGKGLYNPSDIILNTKNGVGMSFRPVNTKDFNKVGFDIGIAKSQTGTYAFEMRDGKLYLSPTESDDCVVVSDRPMQLAWVEIDNKLYD